MKSKVEAVSEQADQDDRGPHRAHLERVLGDEEHVADAARARELLADHHDDHREREARPHPGDDLRRGRGKHEHAGSRSRRGMLYDRAVSISVGSIPRIPSIVLRRIGNRQKKAMNDDLLEVADRRAGARSRSATAPAAASRASTRRAASSRRRPSARARSGSRARSRPRRRDPEAQQDPLEAGDDILPNWEKSQRCWNSTRIVESLGNFGESALAVHSCHAARIASGTAISAATFSVL